MKRRALHTVKILAVAVVAAGCTRTVLPDAQTQAVEPPVPPLPAGAEGQALVALAVELDTVGQEHALEQVAHFRPLCDKDGYPLVGNVTSKAAPKPVPEPAKFCAAVRQKAKP